MRRIIEGSPYFRFPFRIIYTRGVSKTVPYIPYRHPIARRYGSEGMEYMAYPRSLV
jgi:hypothetical protein